ncbi:FAD-dependent monooxygenase [Nonomuraea fuscirosea]
MTGHRPHVIVAGAGPVGLTVALTLARAGVAVTVLEPQTELASVSRAATFHPATLDLLADFGVTEPLAAAATLVDRLQWRTRHSERPLAELRMTLLDGLTAHPFRLHAEQSTLTRLLADELARYPHAEVRSGSAVDGVTHTASQVRAHIRRGWQEADYVIGADGARSTVRAAVDLDFPITRYPTLALRIFTDSPLSEHLPGLAPLTYVRDPNLSCSLLQLPDHWRMVIRLPPRLAAGLTDDMVKVLASQALPSAGEPHIVHWHTYPLVRAVASQFRRGRVLLAGDAAHLTSTAGGFNMNAGIHDAVELGRVLAQVLKGTASTVALDTWAARRRTIMLNTIIPRSEARVAGLEGNGKHGTGTDGTNSLASSVDQLRTLSADPEAARAWLVQASMLDTIPLPDTHPIGA